MEVFDPNKPSNNGANTNPERNLTPGEIKRNSRLAPPWPRGVSGNPSGRPRKRPITERYIEALERPADQRVIELMQLKPGATQGDAVAAAIVRKGMQGDVPAGKELREATEGRAAQRFEFGPQDAGYDVQVEYEKITVRVKEDESTIEAGVDAEEFNRTIDIESQEVEGAQEDDEPQGFTY